ncbi:MAG: SDR family oxidoreductase [Bacteroidota bacterium]
MMNRRIAIITGVSRLEGIGRAICHELANQGCDIFFTYWTEYDRQMPWETHELEPKQIQSELQNLGIRCACLELNLQKVESIQFLFDEVENQLGNPSILINNATFSTESSISSITAQVLDSHYEVNLRATTLLISEFVKRFKFEANGRIVNLTSGQSLGKMPNELAYAITKAAIENLTYTISSEIALKGITINAVNPGPNDTGWMDDKLKSELLPRFPMKRLGNPSDTAKIIGFLVSQEAEWITGQIIHSEGGFMR